MAMVWNKLAERRGELFSRELAPSATPTGGPAATTARRDGSTAGSTTCATRRWRTSPTSTRPRRPTASGSSSCSTSRRPTPRTAPGSSAASPTTPCRRTSTGPLTAPSSSTPRHCSGAGAALSRRAAQPRRRRPPRGRPARQARREGLGPPRPVGWGPGAARDSHRLPRPASDPLVFDRFDPARGRTNGDRQAETLRHAGQRAQGETASATRRRPF